jgi:apolipoprotein N-acyltransferase
MLSVSDSRGRVLAEQSSAAQLGSATAPFSILVASVPVRNQPTFYARTGNWFVWLDLILAAALLVSVKMK